MHREEGLWDMLSSFEDRHTVPKSDKETWGPPQKPHSPKQKDGLRKQLLCMHCGGGKCVNQTLKVVMAEKKIPILSLLPKLAIKHQNLWFGRIYSFPFFKYSLAVEECQNKLRKHEVRPLPLVRQVAGLEGCPRRAKSVAYTSWQDPWD